MDEPNNFGGMHQVDFRLETGSKVQKLFCFALNWSLLSLAVALGENKCHRWISSEILL
jgi:hypothetical protein